MVLLALYGESLIVRSDKLQWSQRNADSAGGKRLLRPS